MSQADVHPYGTPSERETRSDPPPAAKALQQPLRRLRHRPDGVATPMRSDMAVHGVPGPPVE
ncbi:hypothetical protein K3N28_13150 [Glycomyces sp. TRM65418]|uniref:hypothetical protein n=1 Tax=Glycomyces sp. TRM65418 TaxID=2867006 RepID=UPI001CE53DFD|nr:hypothetical protein [Glycomyces sp. TRM65418]MCC3764013.1 hypothetical protein [Glycomyces sp. TRM65418]QZD53706.1 hypothetical protein K3N28_13085 [Glycomyces sp. TRM65418]